MKGFLKKKWHRIPVGIVAVLMALILVAGSAFAGYGFFNATAEVEVVEAIAVGAFGTWDNLKPYGSDTEAVWVDGEPGAGALGDVAISLGGTEAEPTLTITHTAETPFVGEGFCPGEWIVIPLNIRNGSSGPLTLSASVTGTALTIEQTWEENDGSVGTLTTESGQLMCRDFKATETFTSLTGWTAAIEGNGGKSGSAVVGAKVLFVKISVPEDAVPKAYTLTITLERG